MPPGDFQTTWMTKEGQNQVSDLTIQKDKGQISKREYYDRVSNIMNNEMDNQNN